MICYIVIYCTCTLYINDFLFHILQTYKFVLCSYAIFNCNWVVYQKQEAQLMMTNPRGTFRGQSRSSNIVPFHMLGIVSSCAIVTVFKTRCFSDIRFQKCCDLEIWVRGHSRSLKVVPFDRLHVISY